MVNRKVQKMTDDANKAAQEEKTNTAPEPVLQAPKDATAAPNHDETDVAAALERKTADGKGDDEVPESNFQSFATENVELQRTTDTQAVKRVASEILAGQWGHNKEQALQKVQDQLGLSSDEVNTEINRRLQAGAPTALL